MIDFSSRSNKSPQFSDPMIIQGFLSYFRTNRLLDLLQDYWMHSFQTSDYQFYYLCWLRFSHNILKPNVDFQPSHSSLKQRTWNHWYLVCHDVIRCVCTYEVNLHVTYCLYAVHGKKSSSIIEYRSRLSKRVVQKSQLEKVLEKVLEINFKAIRWVNIEMKQTKILR